MKVGLFGGRFDPVHNGHIAVAREVLKLKIVDEVWMLPDFQHQWNPIVASIADRLRMLNLAIRDIKHIKIEKTAINLAESTEIYKVLQLLIRRYPYNEFIFIGGSDQLLSLHKWHNWKRLQEVLRFVIVARNGYSTANKFPNVNIIEDINYQPLEDSSTRLRLLLNKRQSIKGLVDPAVEKYISQKKLYL